MCNHSFAKAGIVVAILITVGALPATAEIIGIRYGFVYGDGPGRVELAGTRGFRMVADALTGRFNLWNTCGIPECQPGTVVEIDAF